MDRSNKNINFDGILEIQKNNIHEALSDTIGPFTGIYPGTQFGFASRLKGMIESACGKDVNVYVSGSVTAEDDLADTIAENIYIRRKRGLLTV